MLNWKPGQVVSFPEQETAQPLKKEDKATEAEWTLVRKGGTEGKPEVGWRPIPVANHWANILEKAAQQNPEGFREASGLTDPKSMISFSKGRPKTIVEKVRAALTRPTVSKVCRLWV